MKIEKSSIFALRMKAKYFLFSIFLSAIISCFFCSTGEEQALSNPFEVNLHHIFQQSPKKSFTYSRVKRRKNNFSIVMRQRLDKKRMIAVNFSQVYIQTNPSFFAQIKYYTGVDYLRSINRLLPVLRGPPSLA